MAKKTITVAFRATTAEKDVLYAHLKNLGIGLKEFVAQSLDKSKNVQPEDYSQDKICKQEVEKYKAYWKKYYDHELFKMVREEGISIYEDDGENKLTSPTQLMDYILNQFRGHEMQ